MITALLISWLFVVSIQLIYILFVYTQTAFYQQPESHTTSLANGPVNGVTVIVCARNELDNLTELLPLLDAQNYPTYEVLVMDDRSTDGTVEFLEKDIAHLKHIRYIRIDKEYEHITPKKYALTIALKKALYPTVLLTDADCRPASDGWLRGMVTAMAAGQKTISLGFFALRVPAWFSEPTYPVRDAVYGGTVFFAGAGGATLYGRGAEFSVSNRSVFFQSGILYPQKHSWWRR